MMITADKFVRVKSGMAFNTDTVEFAIKNSKVLSLTTFSYFVKERRCIDKILSMYLSEIGADELQNKLSYCIHELAGNAHKANTKRVYFKKMGLDINDPEDYLKGMKSFKDSVISNMEQYHNDLKEHGLFLKFYFRKKDSVLKLAIRNNVSLTPQETEKINDKLAAAAVSTNLAATYPEVEDFTEGAGLGIVMIYHMLRNMGFKDPGFKIYSQGNQTVSALELNLCDVGCFADEEVSA